MLKKIVFAVIAVTIVITGCSLFNFGGGDLMPLTVGNYWNMKINMKTTIAAHTTTSISYGRSEITGKVTLGNGKESFSYKTGVADSVYNFDTVYVNTTYFIKEDTAYFSYDSLNQATGDYQGPVTVDIGTVWNANSMKFEVTAKEDVTVPAGTFKNAYKIAMTTTTSDTMWQWIAQGKGSVKSYFKAGDSSYSMETTTELMDYEVK